jgi:hypothetical protein
MSPKMPWCDLNSTLCIDSCLVYLSCRLLDMSDVDVRIRADQ